MNIVSEDIKDILQDDSSLGLVFKDDLFIGHEPSTPDNCVTLYDTGGDGPLLGLNPSQSQYYYSSIQVRIRNNSYKTGLEFANDIMVSLHGRANETWNGAVYTLIQATSYPQYLKKDENERVIFIINFETQRR